MKETRTCKSCKFFDQYAEEQDIHPGRGYCTKDTLNIFIIEEGAELDNCNNYLKINKIDK